MPSVLFVFSSCNKTITGHSTGWYLPEAAHPYYVLAPHSKIDFAAPNGPHPPVDENSVQMYQEDENSVKFLEDETVKEKLAKAKTLSEVDVKDYDAIFYVGGLAPVIDLAEHPVNIKLASQFYQSGKIVSAVCHGPAALVRVVDTSGKSIFSGKRATAFSNAEEEQVGKVKDVPFLVEDEIKKLGGIYESTDLWKPKVVVDGKLLTGQNPASAGLLGQEILRALQEK